MPHNHPFKQIVHLPLLLSILLLSMTRFGNQPAHGERYFFAPHEGVVHKESDLVAGWADKSPHLVEVLTDTSIEFTLIYMDEPGFGFRDEDKGAGRREMFEIVLQYIDSILDESGQCWIHIISTTDSEATYLGRAGTFFNENDGFQTGVSFQSIRHGRDPFDSGGDMIVEINFFRDWNETLDPVGPDDADLYSVLLHEVTHGLGFLSLSDENGESRLLPAGINAFTEYDRLLFDTVAGVYAFDENTIWQGDSFTGGPNTVELRGERALTALGAYPPVHTPVTYARGSSLSHWQPTSPIPSPSVMRHSISRGTMRRVFQPYEIAFLGDLGYNLREDTRVDPESWMIFH